jgi:hypothetical protein
MMMSRAFAKAQPFEEVKALSYVITPGAWWSCPMMKTILSLPNALAH